MGSFSNIALKTLDVYLGDDVNRFAHSCNCAQLLMDIANKNGIKISVRLVNTVLLHDVGYSSQVTLNEDHNMNGYLMFKDSNKVYARAILNHGKNIYDDKSSLIEQYATMVVDYCDSHVDYDGKKCTIDERIANIIKRYGEHSKQAFDIVNLYEYLITVEMCLIDTLMKIQEIENS